MAQEKFKLPRSSYEELCKIIRAYGRLDKPASLEHVTGLTAIGKTNVSANNAFLLAAEIIEGGKNKSGTDKGRTLANALEHNLPEEIENAWRTIVEGNDFLNKMTLAVQIRNGMEISSLEAHIAYSAGEPRATKVMTGARAIIEILLKSGLVKEENDRIVPSEKILSEPERKKVPVPEGKSIPSVMKIPAIEGSKMSGVSLSIQVRIDAKPSELKGLGEKLRAMIESLSEGENKGEKANENAERKG